MADKVTLGGDRIGSGEKIQVERHNYMMNSFNLEQDWKSSMAPGILYPFIKLVGTNHGTFDIDLDTMVRTIPTKGPLFGSFKLQLDLYNVPFRLYNGILHNNPVDIGLQMSQVYLPKMELKTIGGYNAPKVIGSNANNYQVNESALLKYLGISGWGTRPDLTSTTGTEKRNLQCVPILAYYDIFKNYYANKQEEDAYVITPQDTPLQEVSEVGYIQYTTWNDDNEASTGYNEWIPYWKIEDDDKETITGYLKTTRDYWANITIYTKNGKLDLIDILDINGNDAFVANLNDLLEQGHARIISQGDVDFVEGNPLSRYNHYKFYNIWLLNSITNLLEHGLEEDEFGIKMTPQETTTYTSDIVLRPFKLKNIDKMRSKLLACNELGDQFMIQQGELDDPGIWDEYSGVDHTGLPYAALIKQTTQEITWNAFEQNGLVVKTYQSDIFNNWLDTSYINTISSIAAVDTSSGSFTMDSLNWAEKVYELLNRIIVGGGTYQDWQDACYGEGTIRMCETPMYVGGMAAEVMFEEIVSSAETNVNGDFQPLGSLGGRGAQIGKRGGNNIHVKMDEPGYVMGIVSLTPRICYSQGNDWDMVELDSMNDLHKPALDGIGFQDLPVEWFAWWNTALKTTGGVLGRSSAGKQTAWLHYQTAVDKCYGDFAKQDGYSFMVLNRNYEHVEGNTQRGTVKDITTYIDPAKYNYAFAVTDLAAQNFWVQIHSRVTARRKMGAQQLPNL